MFHNVVRGDSRSFTILHEGAKLGIQVKRVRDPGGRDRIDAQLAFDTGTFDDRGPCEFQGKLWHQIDHKGSTLRFRVEIDPVRAAEHRDFRFQVTIDAPREWHITVNYKSR